MLQTWRLAVAIYPDERTRPGRPPLVGLGGCDLVDGECRRGVGGWATARGRGAARSAALVGGYGRAARPTAPSPIAAPGLVVVPGVSGYHWRPATAAAIPSRTVAGDTACGIGAFTSQ